MNKTLTDNQIVNLAKQVTGWTTHGWIPQEPLGHFYAGPHHQASVDNVIRIVRAALLSAQQPEPFTLTSALEWAGVPDVCRKDPEPSAEVADSWVRVDERLPACNRKAGSPGIEVLIYPAMETGECTAFFGKRISVKPMFYRYGAPVHGVTHWMALPDAPANAARAGEGQ